MNQLPPRKPKSGNNLSARQQEILRLLCEGRSNKDIADQLDISLGTVKQHLVGLFKKMNVSNRAMAVSQGMAQQAEENSQLDSSSKGFLLRPCIALSIGLNRDSDTDSARLLHKTLAGLAFDSRAYFLERGRYSADIVLGLKHYAENTAVSSLQICLMLQQELQFHSAEILDNLRIGFSISMALVQKDRFSQDSSSDLVASPIINDSRQLMESGSWGSIRFSDSALSVFKANGLAIDQLDAGCISLNQLTTLFINNPISNPNSELATFGREALLDELTKEARINEQRVTIIEGENGLGKTHICRTLFQQFSSSPDYSCHCYLALPVQPPLQFIDTFTGEYLTYHQLISKLEESKNIPNEIVLFDDFHLAPNNFKSDLVDLAYKRSGHSFFFGRHLKSLAPDATHSLGKLNNQNIEELVSAANPEIETNQVKQIVENANGVPLFACELSEHHNKNFPLSLLMVVAARLDAFQLDWQLLHTLSQGPKALQLEQLKTAMGTTKESLLSSLEIATKVGVLSCKGEGEQTWVSFQHPLIRHVIKILSANWSEAQHGI